MSQPLPDQERCQSVRYATRCQRENRHAGAHVAGICTWSTEAEDTREHEGLLTRLQKELLRERRSAVVVQGWIDPNDVDARFVRWEAEAKRHDELADLLEEAWKALLDASMRERTP